MNQDPNNSEELDLQLAQRIIELTKVVEENKVMIEKLASNLEHGNSTIEECEKQLQDWDLKLGTSFEEIRNQISALDEKLEQQDQNVKNENQKFVTQVTELEEKLNHQIQNIDTKFDEVSSQFTEIQEVQNKHDETISSQQNTLEEQKTEIQDRVREEQFKNTFDEAVKDLNEKISSLNQNQESLQSEIENYIEKTQEQFESLAKTIELVADGLSQLEDQNKNHSLILEEQRNSLRQFKQKLKDLISLSKEDQKTHFENFSRIIESYNENIRTELTIAAQSLKESDTQILDEVSASFMPKKVGKELQKTIADLASELKMETQKTRDDLVQGLQENVQEYEKTMEGQNTSIKNYQKQLEEFQDEILAIIDRKVNEKYEVVFSLLSKVAVQAEELALLIKTSEIHISSFSSQKDQILSVNDEENQEEEFSPSESSL
ncbi:MAG: hypothetical protein JSW11_21170 [Candidatus Heimdallarchaeota archaeon]|nr:MAG: hypothetical protein JSW11_21170 [Candidatus Heimdallarchaeota archaeon]